MAVAPPISVQVTVDQRDIDRITRRLDKWQGKPLETRMAKAIQGGLTLLRGPIRAAAIGPGNERAPKDATGKLRAAVQVWALKKRRGEAAAYAVGPRGGRSKRLNVAPHRHLVIRGHRMVTHSGQVVGFVTGQPFVDEAVAPLWGQVRSFIDEQIRKVS